MKIDVTVPAIGESITEVTMGSWLVEEGAHVEEDDVICEIESEKATVEVTAEKSG
ncbi:MAG: dihydrolipoyllysine-residue succinyltransferase, partial [Calditrichaeota bacterium]